MKGALLVVVAVLLLAACRTQPYFFDEDAAPSAVAGDAGHDSMVPRDGALLHDFAGCATVCGVECVDLEHDPKNCGACGVVCPETECVCGAGHCRARQIGFGAAGVYLVGFQPVALAAADFDGDKHIDLVVANSGNDMSLLLSRGDGTFLDERRFARGRVPFECDSVAAVDLDGNGTIDLVTANDTDEKIAVQLGTGHGGFRAPLYEDAGAEPIGLVVTDLDGDGVPDVAVTNTCRFNCDSVTVLLGVGDGSFRLSARYDAGKLPFDLATADFNGDGLPDLVTANNGSSDASLLLSTGHGGFDNQPALPMGLGPIGIAAGDWNGDGHPDLATVGPFANQLSVRLGLGDGRFGALALTTVGAQPLDIAFADFNCDGHLDLVVANQQGNDVSVLPGRGDGSFGPELRIPVGQNQTAVVAVDFNGDGLPDIAVTDFTDAVRVILNTSN